MAILCSLVIPSSTLAFLPRCRLYLATTPAGTILRKPLFGLQKDAPSGYEKATKLTEWETRYVPDNAPFQDSLTPPRDSQTTVNYGNESTSF